jgi:glycosyltransferase involved in cell wall biosynthesis
MKKNILIISIYYPPIQSIASNRIYSFAKYLSKEKFKVYVHTLDEGKSFTSDLEGVNVSRVKNNSFFKRFIIEKKSNKLIHYSKVIYNKLLALFVTDSYAFWTKNSIVYLSKKIKDEKIDIIFSSFSPASSHIVALALKEKYPHLIWISDMRDEMSASPFIGNKQKRRYIALENKIFENCDALTSVSKPILNEFRDMSHRKNIIFREIRNGYDFKIEKKMNKNTIFTIVYMGNFYGERNPDTFLRAFSELVKEDKIDNFEIKFIGVKTHFYIPENLKNSLFIKDSIPHKDAIVEIKKSDCLLLIHPNNGRKGVFTGKLFEYLATLNPIIALVDTEDVAAKLIKSCNSGYVSELDDIENIKHIILEAFSDWTQDIKRDIKIDIIEQHHRKEQVKRLEKLIEELSNE